MLECRCYWSTWYGVASGVLFDWEDDRLLTLTLLAGDAGVLAAALIAPKLDLSVGRARLISVTGLAGAIAGMGLDLLMDVQDDKTAIAVPMASSLLGLGMGVAWTKHYDTRASDEIPGSNALLNLGRGRVGWAVPTPTPAVLTVGLGERGRVRRELGINLSLLRASF